MRIAVLIKNTTLHPSYGGFETQNQVLCKGLVSKGHEVVVFAPKKELSKNEAIEDGIKYIFIECIFRKFSSVFSPSPDSWYNKSYEVFLQEHKKKPFDIVVSQSSWGLGVIYHKKEMGIGVVAVSHGTKIGEYQTQLKSIKSPRNVVRALVDLPHVLRTFFTTQRQFIHGSDKVIAVSSSVKKAIVEETFVDENKIVVIHNGIDPNDVTASKPSEKNSAKLIYVGRVEVSKGLHILIEAIKDIDNVTLEIIGDGPYMVDLKNLVQKHSLNGKVSFRGKLPHDMVLKSLADSDIFVLPTLRVEGFPMTLVEAMFAGLPVIASDIGGNSDAVDEDTGFLVESGNASILKEKINTLIHDPKLRQSMSVKALEKAKKKFTVDVMISKYLSVFDSVISESKNKNL